LDLARDLRLVRVLTGANIQSRYRNTFYGFLWVVMNPILTYAVQVFAFTTIFHVKSFNYPVYLLAGLFPWMFILQSVEMCTSIFLFNATMIKNIPMSPMLLVLVQVLDNLSNFLSAYLILILYFVFTHTLSIFNVAYILLPTIPLLISVISLCFIFSLYNVRYRDLRFVVSFAFSLLFYLTPIFYHVELVPERMRFIVYCNPFFYLIKPFQDILMSNGENIFPDSLFLAFMLSAVLATMAYRSWKKMKKFLVFYV
jgi:ABC-type polysaccharide/polyol phosphate export permease